MTVKEKVAKGVKLLDDKYGDTWRAKVDIDTLNMGSSKSCILGQTDSDYGSHLRRLNVNPMAHGFDVLMFPYSTSKARLQTLECEWKRVLKEKR